MKMEGPEDHIDFIPERTIHLQMTDNATRDSLRVSDAVRVLEGQTGDQLRTNLHMLPLWI